MKEPTCLADIPITERFGVWAHWSEQWDYLYGIEDETGFSWKSCLALHPLSREEEWHLPISQTGDCLPTHTSPCGRMPDK